MHRLAETCYLSDFPHIWWDTLWAKHCGTRRLAGVLLTEYLDIQPIVTYFKTKIPHQNGEYFLTSFNFGNLNSHSSFEVGANLFWGPQLWLMLFFRTFSSTMFPLGTREATSLILWSKGVTTASGWSTTGSFPFLVLLIDLSSQEPSVPDCYLLEQPNLYRRDMT